MNEQTGRVRVQRSMSSSGQSVSASTTTGEPPASSPMGRLTFSRQSGWMVIATTVSGALMFAVHKAAKQMPTAEYGVFITLLQVLNLMAVPAVGLQLTFVQQTVVALNADRK